jgi:uncharacterized protein
MKKNQRFIAGAKCPECNEPDSMLLNLDDQSIECVDCGFSKTEAERNKETAEKNEQSGSVVVNKVPPKKVNVSSIIRVKQVDE